MRTLLSLCLVVSWALAVQGQALNIRGIQGVTTAAHASGEFDGVVLVSENGKITLAIAVGDADRATKRPNTPETVFRLASLTKQVTSLLVMQQVSAGRMALDQPAGELMKSLPPSIARVSVRQLLQHVSGLPNPSDGPDGIVPPFYLRKDADAGDNTKAALGFCSGTPKRLPGERFEYNNCDYLVLRAILEAVTGKRYPQLVQERVIAPLGLQSWGVFPASGEPPPVAHGYRKDGTPELAENPATYGAAGALYGNALDLAKWDQALLAHKLLPEEATDTMFRADPKLYGEALGSWSYDLPGTKPPVHLVERQGDIECTVLLNLLLPQRNAAIIIIANTERTDLFNTYNRKGFGYQVATAALSAN